MSNPLQDFDEIEQLEIIEALFSDSSTNEEQTKKLLEVNVMELIKKKEVQLDQSRESS